MTQSISLADTNDQRGFDVLETLPRLEPTFEQEKCDLIDNPSTNKQFTLREAIVDGRIPQGEQLREAHLARVLETAVARCARPSASSSRRGWSSASRTKARGRCTT